MSTIEYDHTQSVFYYLATPYSKADDLDAAALEAARIAGALISAGHHVYSPVVHGHAIKAFINAEARDSAFWVNLQRPFIAAAAGLYIATMDGWAKSEGIAAEDKLFREAKKPIWYVDPETLALTYDIWANPDAVYKIVNYSKELVEKMALTFDKRQRLNEIK